MTSFSIHRFTAPVAARAADRRVAGAAVTLVIHLALILGWRMARTLPHAQIEDARSAIQWLRLPALPPHTEEKRSAPPEETRRRPDRAPAHAVLPGLARRQTEPDPAPASALAAPRPATEPVFSAEGPAKSGAESIIESARRSAGSIDRAMRKENRSYITAPLDSPQIRMRNGMEQAHAMAPGRLWEAPKIEELVNNTGDGARRTRVITGNGTYCVTERSAATSVDMIEKHGKLRFTNCPQHEEPAKQQEWRTARD
jgi:hypothetical protein